jgi:propanediol dehydratase small subunit
MAIKSPFFIRVVPQDKGRGFELLGGFDKKIVKATAVGRETFATREELTTLTTTFTSKYNASSVTDVTAEAIKNQLRKLFNEPAPEKTEA